MAEKEDGKKDVPSTLMDAEHQEALAERERRTLRLSRVAHEIEAILVREEMTWGEWGEVVELFSTRIGTFVANIKINFLK